MKIKIIKDLHLPFSYYKQGTVINTLDIVPNSRKEYTRLYEMFIKSGYAIEVMELINNFKEDETQFIMCQVCKNFTDPINKCENCKYYQYTDFKKDIHEKAINIIKSQ